MTRFIHVCTSHGVGMPALRKAAAAEVFAHAADAQLAKGRIRPTTTNVSRYVARASPAVARALRRILTAKRKALAAQVRALLPDVSKLAKDTGAPTRIIASLIENLQSQDLGLDLEGELAGAMLAAFRRAAAIGATQVGMSIATDQVDEAATAYAARRGGELIKDLAGTTRDDMRALLERAVLQGMSADELSTAVEGLGAFSDYRADMIARTELAYAHVQGNVEGWRASGEVVGKRSILSDLHDVPDQCDEAAEAGVVGIDEEFVEGYALPPYHPNCMCDVVPVLRDADDDPPTP
jgi:hypothetical protein